MDLTISFNCHKAPCCTDWGTDSEVKDGVRPAEPSLCFGLFSPSSVLARDEAADQEVKANMCQLVSDFLTNPRPKEVPELLCSPPFLPMLHAVFPSTPAAFYPCHTPTPVCPHCFSCLCRFWGAGGLKNSLFVQ